MSIRGPLLSRNALEATVTDIDKMDPLRLHNVDPLRLHNITRTKQHTTKPCAYFMGCTVCRNNYVG